LPSALKIGDLWDGVPKSLLVGEPLRNVLGDVGVCPKGRAEDLDAGRAPNLGAELLHAWRANACAIPRARLARVELDARYFTEGRGEQVVDRANTVWLSDGVHVVEEGEDVLVVAQVRLHLLKRVMNAEGEKQGHQRVSLLAALALHHKVLLAIFVEPRVARGLCVREADERQHRAGRR